VFTLRELREMLRDAGLEPVAEYASLDRTPFALGAPSALLVAEKAQVLQRDVTLHLASL
jgi:hypothetical protein